MGVAEVLARNVVVDASVVYEALTTDGPARERLATRQLFAPHLLDLEVLHALRRLALAGGMTTDHGSLLLERLRVFGLTRYPVHGLTPRIWELRDNLTAYDASYVAVAEALECTLLTTDARMAAAPGIRCAVEVVPRGAA